MHHARTLIATAALCLAAPAAAHAAPPPRGQHKPAPKRQAPAPAPAPAPEKSAPPAERTAPAKTAAPAAAIAPRPGASGGTRRGTLHLTNSEHLALPERELNGHYFLPPLSINLPFITSHVGSSTAVLTTDLTDIPGGGDLGLHYFSLAQAFELQLGILDRVALRGFLLGNATAPTETDSALIISLIGGYSAGAGATVKVLETREVALSGSFDWTRQQDVLVSPAPFLEDVFAQVEENMRILMENPGAELPGIELNPELLFTESVSNDLAFGGQVAWAPHRVIGLFAEVGWDAEFQEERNDAFLRLGGGASLNFESVGVPVGLLGYTVHRFPMDGENATELDQLVAGGLYYTGRRYLDVGLELQAQFVEVDEINQDALGVAARIRSYF